MTRICRHCDQPAVSYSNAPLCRQHYNERRRKGRPRQPRQPSAVCKQCGAPRKQGVTVALCADHYRDYARRQVRRSRGMDPDAPVKVVDTSKCKLCDEPRLPYGVMCRQCLRNYEVAAAQGGSAAEVYGLRVAGVRAAEGHAAREVLPRLLRTAAGGEGQSQQSREDGDGGKGDREADPAPLGHRPAGARGGRAGRGGGGVRQARAGAADAAGDADPGGGCG